MSRESVTIVTVLRSGGAYDARHVEVIERALRKYGGFDGRFVCLTDTPAPLERAGIETLSLQLGLPGWWSKIELFRLGLFGGPVLYMDLDTLVLGRIDELVDMARQPRNEPLLLRGLHLNAQRYDQASSGLIAWHGDQMAQVYTRFVERWQDEYERKKRFVGDLYKAGDQEFIRSVVNPQTKIQDLLPAGYLAYKREVRHTNDGAVSDPARLLVWSGRPRIHRAVSGRDRIVADYWDGLSVETHLRWDRILEELRQYSVVLVTGPHRAGTTLVTVALADSLGWDCVTESAIRDRDGQKEFSFRSVHSLIDDVSQHPVVMHGASCFKAIERFQRPHVATVYVHRDYGHTFASQKRMHGKTIADPRECLRTWHQLNDNGQINASFDVHYEAFSDHRLFCADRGGWESRQVLPDGTQAQDLYGAVG